MLASNTHIHNEGITIINNIHCIELDRTWCRVYRAKTGQKSFEYRLFELTHRIATCSFKQKTVFDILVKVNIKSVRL